MVFVSLCVEAYDSMRPSHLHEIGSEPIWSGIASQPVLTSYKLLEIERPIMGAPKEHPALQGRVQRPGESRRAASVLTDHLVGQHEQGRGNGDGERLGGVEVDEQVEFHW